MSDQGRVEQTGGEPPMRRTSSRVLVAVVLGAVVLIGAGTLGIASPSQPTHMAAGTHSEGAFVCALQTGPTRLTGPVAAAAITPQSQAVDSIRASLAAPASDPEP